jgi:hypothetical protein
VRAPFHHGIDPNALGLTVQPWFQSGWVLRTLGRWQNSLVFRGWPYLLLLAALLVVPCVWRRADRTMIWPLAASGACYLLTAFLVSPVPEFRFNVWPVMAALVGAVLLWTDRRASTPPPTVTSPSGSSR